MLVLRRGPLRWFLLLLGNLLLLFKIRITNRERLIGFVLLILFLLLVGLIVAWGIFGDASDSSRLYSCWWTTTTSSTLLRNLSLFDLIAWLHFISCGVLLLLLLLLLLWCSCFRNCICRIAFINFIDLLLLLWSFLYINRRDTLSRCEDSRRIFTLMYLIVVLYPSTLAGNATTVFGRWEDTIFLLEQVFLNHHLQQDMKRVHCCCCCCSRVQGYSVGVDLLVQLWHRSSSFSCSPPLLPVSRSLDQHQLQGAFSLNLRAAAAATSEV